MSQIMNHREIEYFAKKYWTTQKLSTKNIVSMFGENQKSKELMEWIEETLGKVIDEDLAMDYGRDCLRCYLLFEKTPVPNDPFYDSWDEGGLEGVYKFVSKYRRMIIIALEANENGFYCDMDVKKVNSLVDNMKKDAFKYLQKENNLPNRHNILSVFMEGCKNIQKELKISELTEKEHHEEIAHAVPHDEQNHDIVDKQELKAKNVEIYTLCKKVVVMLAPFVPYISEELWQLILLYETGSARNMISDWYENIRSTSVFEQKWTTEDTVIDEEVISIPVQVNARTRRTIDITHGMTREQVEMLAKIEIKKYLTPGMEYQIIYIPNKLINFVIK